MADNKIQQVQEALKNDPTVSACVYEVLIRGDYGDPGTFGVIKAAHFEIKVKSPDVLGNPQESTTGRLTASLVATSEGTPLVKIIPVLLIMQQQALDAANKQIEDQAKQIKELQAGVK